MDSVEQSQPLSTACTVPLPQIEACIREDLEIISID